MFPDEAKPAVEMAADIWAQSIETVVPIQMEAKFGIPCRPTCLAQSSPSEVMHDFDGAPL